jgi:hypothetical protein
MTLPMEACRDATIVMPAMPIPIASALAAEALGLDRERTTLAAANPFGRNRVRTHASTQPPMVSNAAETVSQRAAFSAMLVAGRRRIARLAAAAIRPIPAITDIVADLGALSPARIADPAEMRADPMTAGIAAPATPRSIVPAASRAGGARTETVTGTGSISFMKPAA